MENKELVERLNKLETELAAQRAEIDLVKNLLGQVQQEVTELKATVEAQEAAIESLLEQKAGSAVAEKSASTALKGTEFTVGKTKYKLQYPSFVFEGKTYDEDSLLAAPDVQKKLVESGSRIFVKI